MRTAFRKAVFLALASQAVADDSKTDFQTIKPGGNDYMLSVRAMSGKADLGTIIADCNTRVVQIASPDGGQMIILNKEGALLSSHPGSSPPVDQPLDDGLIARIDDEGLRKKIAAFVKAGFEQTGICGQEKEPKINKMREILMEFAPWRRLRFLEAPAGSDGPGPQ